MDAPTPSPTDVRAALGIDRRQRWESGPSRNVPTNSWQCFDDDTLLAWIQALPDHHRHDDQLLEIVRSSRHFYVRQIAALHIGNPERLKPFCDDRHVGQILARRLSRADDATYLLALAKQTRHLEVKRAAQAQLAELQQRLAVREPGPPRRATP